MSCASSRYLGAATPWGVVVEVEPRIYNPVCKVVSKDGETRQLRLAFLVAHGVRRPGVVGA